MPINGGRRATTDGRGNYLVNSALREINGQSVGDRVRRLASIPRGTGCKQTDRLGADLNLVLDAPALLEAEKVNLHRRRRPCTADQRSQAPQAGRIIAMGRERTFHRE